MGGGRRPPKSTLSIERDALPEREEIDVPGEVEKERGRRVIQRGGLKIFRTCQRLPNGGQLQRGGGRELHPEGVDATNIKRKQSYYIKPPQR